MLNFALLVKCRGIADRSCETSTVKGDSIALNEDKGLSRDIHPVILDEFSLDLVAKKQTDKFIKQHTVQNWLK